MDILSEMFGFPITQFSVHRPSPDVLRENIKLPGILNAYQDEFFTFAEKVTDQTPLKVKYMSDANHIWRYGYPDEANITGYDKVQILTHPFAWSKKGYDNRDNYAVLIQEKYNEMIDSINNECKDFCEFKDEFLEASLIPEGTKALCAGISGFISKGGLRWKIGRDERCDVPPRAASWKFMMGQADMRLFAAPAFHRRIFPRWDISRCA